MKVFNGGLILKSENLYNLHATQEHHRDLGASTEQNWNGGPKNKGTINKIKCD